MLKSKNTFIKVGSTILFVFLSLMLVISFGVPSFMDRMGINPTTIAVVNGKEVSVYDYRFFLSTDSRFAGRQNEILNDENMNQYVQQLFIRRVLAIQYAEKLGVVISKDQVFDYIRNISYFKGEDGKFSTERMDAILAHYNMTFDQFFDRSKNTLMLLELNNLVNYGTGFGPDEVRMVKTADSSHFVLKYAFLSESDIKNKYADEIAVSDDEIDAELAKLKDENAGDGKIEADASAMAEPQKSRESVKALLERQKIASVKVKIEEDLKKFQNQPAAFDKAVAYLGTGVKMSKAFSLGSPVYGGGEKGKILYDLYMSSQFNEDFLSVELNSMARPINASSGIYVYAPVERQLESFAGTDVSYEEGYSLVEKRFNELENALLDPFFEQSKIVRNYK